MFSLIFTTLLQAALAQAPLPGDYEIGPGDVIDVKVHGHDFGRSTFVVGTDGRISFPYVGDVFVGARNVYDAEEALVAALADGYLVDPQVTVQVAEFRSKRVEVLGSVGKPGVYFLDGPTTVRAVVAMAGGVKLGDAGGGDVLLTRGADTTRITLKELESPLGDQVLQAGDVVTIDADANVVYLTGEVSKPGAIGYSDGLTVSQALIRAGGNSGLGRLSGSYILRDGDRISVNLKRVLRGKDADVVLEPGDRVVIPESPL